MFGRCNEARPIGGPSGTFDSEGPSGDPGGPWGTLGGPWGTLGDLGDPGGPSGDPGGPWGTCETAIVIIGVFMYCSGVEILVT